jgi:hypothetical protein
VIRRDRGVCHICGHTGAKVPDHLVPVAERPDLALDAANIRAAHGYLKNGGGECTVCSAAAVSRGGKVIFCNEIRGALSVDRARRLIEKRTGLSLGGTAEEPLGERDWLLPQVPGTEMGVKLCLRTELRLADAALESAADDLRQYGHALHTPLVHQLCRPRLHHSHV